MPPSAPPRPRAARPPTRRRRRRGSPAPARPTARPARCSAASRRAAMAAAACSTSVWPAAAPPSRPRRSSTRSRSPSSSDDSSAIAPLRDLGAQLGRPLGGRRLHRQRPQPGAHLALEVAGALELRLDPGQLRLGPRAAALVLAQPRRLLDEPAALVRLGQQDLLDPALADHGVHLAAEAGVGQQLQHVQPPHLGPVQVVLALAVAVEPAHHRHLVELDRQRAALVVEHQLDLADAGRRARVGSRRTARPGRSGARSWAGDCTAIAHCRASAMLDLPLPLGPTTTAMPWSKLQLDVLGERLEAPHANRLQIHPRSRSAYQPARAICASASRAASCSDAFLLRPEPRPSSASSTSAAVVKRRSWSGPVVSTSA